MAERELQMVTGAFGYSGKYLARRLLGEGHEVRTLTNSPDRPNPFGDQVRAFPYNFEEPAKLVESLRGVRVLYNTYWVRFNYVPRGKSGVRAFTHAAAVENTLKLFAAAKEAGVGRIVHVSITNPSEDSELEYFRGKAVLERELVESGLSYAILRPAVLFGDEGSPGVREDILLNNIAWTLRRLPVFGVFGQGSYRLQPIHVDDLAAVAVRAAKVSDSSVINALGPETFTYRELVRTIGELIGRRRPIVCVPPSFGYCVGWLLGKLAGDVMITREEIRGLMADLLCVEAPPAGTTRLTDWVRENADHLGVKYASEIGRRRQRHRDE